MRRIAVLMGAGIIALLLSAAGAFASEITISDVGLSGSSIASAGQTIYTDEVKISFKAESEAGITAVSLMLEGKAAGEEAFEGEPAASGSITVGKSFLSANEPPDHKFTGKLKAEDADGAERDCDIEFFADVTEPSVSVAGITGGGIYKAAVTVRVKMEDAQLSGAQAQIIIKRNGTLTEQQAGIESCRDYSKELSDEGRYELTASCKDAGGHTAEKSIRFTIDKTAPSLSEIELSGERAESSGWYKAGVRVKASAADELSGIGTVKIYADGILLKSFSSAGECAFEIEQSWFKERDTKSGKHVIRLTAEDKAGNTAVREVSFYADAEAPSLSYSGIGDGDFTNQPPEAVAKAEDNHLEQTAVYMEVYKDGEKIDERSAGGSCAYKPEEDGKYRLISFAEDAAGNRSEREEITFTLDRRPPVIDMHSLTGHKKDGYVWFDTSITSKAEASDSLSGLSSAALFVNGKQVKTCSPAGDLKAALEKTLGRTWFSENESADGSYVFQIIAEDRAGNRAEAEKKACADVKTPSAALSGIKSGAHTKKTPKISVQVQDNYAEKNTIVIRITRDGKTDHRFERAGESTYTKAFKKDGSYVVSVYGVDKAGNTSKVKKLSFVKDTAAPVLALAGAKKGEYYSSARTISARVKERNYKTVKVTSSMKMVVDEKTQAPSFGKIVPTSRSYVQKKKLSKTGTYTITLRAQDKAGNKAKPVSLTFTVDTEKPEISITGAEGVKGYDALCAPKAAVKDSYYESSRITLSRITKKSAAGLLYKDSKKRNGAVRSYADFKKEKNYDDIYTLTVTAKDKAGNFSRLSKTFTVCRFGSRFSAAPEGLSGAYITKLDRDIIIAEKTPADLKEQKGILRLDGQTLAQARLSQAKIGGWNRYFYTFPKELFTDEGVYSLDTESTDSAGSVSRFSAGNSFTLYVDKTPPVISLSGVQKGGRYKTSQAKARLSVSDNIRAATCTVKANGRTIYASEGKTFRTQAQVQIPEGLNQRISVRATDAAGNTGRYELRSVTVSDSFFLRLFASKAFVAGLAAALAAAVFAAVLFARRRKRGEGEEENAGERG